MAAPSRSQSALLFSTSVKRNATVPRGISAIVTSISPVQCCAAITPIVAREVHDIAILCQRA
jgi:hypothetical protein